MKQALASAKRRPTLRNVKTAVSARIRSKPCAEGQRYLELYTLQRDRVRWNQLKGRAEQALQDIDRNLADLGFRQDLNAEDQAGRPPVASPVSSRSRSKKIQLS